MFHFNEVVVTMPISKGEVLLLHTTKANRSVAIATGTPVAYRRGWFGGFNPRLEIPKF
jgi:hypothetical protein